MHTRTIDLALITTAANDNADDLSARSLLWATVISLWGVLMWVVL